MTKSNLAGYDERPDTPPTHIMYTPVWEPGGGKFRKWLPVGNLWHDDPNDEMFAEIEALPVNAEETAIDGYFRSAPVGKAPPAPLTVTREEFLEQEVMGRR
jgi:hypothetical protein